MGLALCFQEGGQHAHSPKEQWVGGTNKWFTSRSSYHLSDPRLSKTRLTALVGAYMQSPIEPCVSPASHTAHIDSRSLDAKSQKILWAFSTVPKTDQMVTDLRCDLGAVLMSIKALHLKGFQVLALCQGYNYTLLLQLSQQQTACVRNPEDLMLGTSSCSCVTGSSSSPPAADQSLPSLSGKYLARSRVLTLRSGGPPAFT